MLTFWRTETMKGSNDRYIWIKIESCTESQSSLPPALPPNPSPSSFPLLHFWADCFPSAWTGWRTSLIATFSALWLQLSHPTYAKWQSKITSFCEEEAVLNTKHFYMKFQLHIHLITYNLIFCACNFSSSHSPSLSHSSTTLTQNNWRTFPWLSQ